MATCLGAGYFPIAPGTAGTVVPGVPLGLLLSSLSPWAAPAAAVLLFVAGWWAAPRCERLLGRRDPPQVVIDEVAGFLVALAGLEPRWGPFLAAFLLFRALDIVKPWPAGLIDRRVPGGLGIMLDDVAAGLYARLIVEAGLRVFA